MNQPHAVYLWPGQTHFGFGVSLRSGPEAHALGATHAFLVADPGVVAAGLAKPIIRSLVDAGLTYTLHDAITSNPSVYAVDTAAQAYRAANADILVAIGGGSAIDTGKGVRMLVMNPHHSIADYSFRRGVDAAPAPPVYEMPPLFAIPTTAGSGAEATPWAVITDVENMQTFGVGGPSVTPSLALVDPGLTLGLPPVITATTGMDALTNLIDAYVSSNVAPLLDPMILGGIRLVARSLATAVNEGGDKPARAEVMQGAFIGGIALSTKWLGACHALASPLAAACNLPYGLANAIMLPHQMAFSLPAAVAQYAEIGAAMRPALSGSVEARAEAAVDAVRALLEECRLPTRLRDVGVTEAQMQALPGYALQDLGWTTSPRPVVLADLEGMYRAAW